MSRKCEHRTLAQLETHILAEDDVATLPPTEIHTIEALFNLSFGKKATDPDSFTGILNKRPGNLLLMRDQLTGTLRHASIFNFINREPHQLPIVYHSVSATRPDQQGLSLGSRALTEIIDQTITPCILLARTQNPMELGTVRRAAQQIGLGPEAVCPIFRPPTDEEISALAFLIQTKAPHSRKTVWISSQPEDLLNFIARKAYSQLSQPNMISHLDDHLDWTRPTASKMKEFMQAHNLDQTQGDAIFIGLTIR